MHNIEELVMTSHSTFLETLDAKIATKHLLQHDFYRAWSCGQLSLDCLREYTRQYYHHIKAFPTYLSAAHSRTEHPAARRSLLQNLIEEEAGSPNHPDLWRQFAHALGVSDRELDAQPANTEMRHLIQVFRDACTAGTTAQAVAALYAYESQIPPICVSKIDGLQKHYEMHQPKDWEYFHVHIAADQEHAAQERELLGQLIQASDQSSVEQTVGRVLDALWNFLTGLCEQFQVRCAH
jgi:pyrroloquinoline-quinone synthase